MTTIHEIGLAAVFRAIEYLPSDKQRKRDAKLYGQPRFVRGYGLDSHVVDETGAPLSPELADEIFAPRVLQVSDEYDVDAEWRLHWRGPAYDLDSAALTKWRAIARERKLTGKERESYAAAIEAAVKAQFRVAPARALPSPGWYRQRSPLTGNVGPSYTIEGKKKTEAWWESEYAAVMADNRKARRQTFKEAA